MSYILKPDISKIEIRNKLITFRLQKWIPIINAIMKVGQSGIAY